MVPTRIPLLIAVFGVLLAAAAQAQPTSPEARSLIGLFVGKQIIAACRATPSPAAQAKLDAELTRRQAGQTEVSDHELQVMGPRIRDNLSSPENQANACGQLRQIGPDAYIDLIVSQ